MKYQTCHIPIELTRTQRDIFKLHFVKQTVKAPKGISFKLILCLTSHNQKKLVSFLQCMTCLLKNKFLCIN